MQVLKLLERTVRFRKMGVTGASVVLNYTQRRIQPLYRRVHFAFQYQGTEDPDRLFAEPIDYDGGLRVI